jgi:L-amino acid N-acyltransferase YncA
MSIGSASQRSYPWTTVLRDQSVTLRPMQASDRDAVLAFAQGLPADDLLFLPLDITHPKVVDGWVRSLQTSRTVTIVAESAGRLIGMGTLVRSETSWARHLGNIRLLVAPDARGIGLGNLLATEIFAAAETAGLQKIVAQMAAEQRGAITVFERLGFKAEALLADYVMDRQGRTHDLIVMSYDVTGLTE